MAPLKGVERQRKRLATGFAEYWYAWRGGPQILAVTAPSIRVRDLKVAVAAEAAGRLYHEAHEARRIPPQGYLHGLAWLWLQSPEFKALGDRTRKDLAKYVAVVQQDLGEMPVRALDAKGCRKELIAWRNGYKDRPRMADHYASALSQLLVWARDQGHTAADPMRKWPWIYQVDRSGVVWTAQEIEAVCRQAKPELQRAILAAAYSGLRQADLLALTWSAIDEAAGVIVRRTRKRKRVVHIPITPTLRAVLDACPRGDAVQVLTYLGEPWKVSTLNKLWARARAAAAKQLPDIQAKRWHDMRGSFATLLIRSGALDDDVDRIMGWKKGNSELTRASYVTGAVIADAAIARLRQFGAAR